MENESVVKENQTEVDGRPVGLCRHAHTHARIDGRTGRKHNASGDQQDGRRRHTKQRENTEVRCLRVGQTMHCALID